MSNLNIRTIPINGFLRVVLLGSGLVLTMGSSGTAKTKGNSAVTIENPKCQAARPASLNQSAQHFMNKCSANGGTPESKFARKPCGPGKFLFGVEVTCTGAQISKGVIARNSAAAKKLPTTAAEKAAMTRAILLEHNRLRILQDLKPLVWSNKLAADAAQWAEHIIDKGGQRLFHSSGTGQGENLWLGTAGAYSYIEMVKSWGDEKKNFVNGTFPNVSRTGNWHHISHYSQIMWRDTREVGCALLRGGGNDILVCRYSPQGNVHGKKPY
jgi:uncharacterized protein YkwD